MTGVAEKRTSGESTGTQRPPWLRPISHIGQDPDYRFTLANERTFLAYVRTSLALLAGGVAVVKLVPSFGVPGGRHALSILLISLSIVTAASSYRRWRIAEVAMRLQQKLPDSYLPQTMAVGLGVVSVVSLILVLTSA